VSEVEFLAVDLETTGLDPRRHHVLAIGWLPVTALQVVLAGAREVVVRLPDGVDVGDSATVHRLTDDTVAGARALGDVLPELLADLHGRVLLAHHAPIELGFLGRAAQQTYDATLPITAVDTMSLQHQLVVGQHGEVRPGSLRLDEARRHFGLPRYGAHRALTDAFATGELLLAQVSELEHRLGREPVLADLSSTRRR
jgi:DNA polymerase-3 subunit epsilon